MSLVKVTSNTRNGTAYANDMLVNLSRITEPVIENISNETIISLRETPNLQNHVNQGNNKVEYILDETLAAFTALKTTEMFPATVVSRDGKIPVETNVTFIIENIVGLILEDPAGSKFLYEEEGGLVPIEYIVSNTITAINLALA